MIKNPRIALWLYLVSLLVAVTAATGAWVRLTNSTPVMAACHPLSGLVPPLSAVDWQQALDQYRAMAGVDQTGHGASLAAFRTAYYLSWGHRLLGVGAGVAYLIPLVVLAVRRLIPGPRLPTFALVGALFVLQLFLGWALVARRLAVPAPTGHLWLALHVLVALLLLSACLWLALGYACGQAHPTQPRVSAAVRRLCLLLLTTALVQATAGGLVAGLQAGNVADTFPLMRGQWIPAGVWQLRPVLANHLSNPLMVQLQHRWFALVVVLVAVQLQRRAHLEILPGGLGVAVKSAVRLALAQVATGIGLVVLHMPDWMASLHQVLAVGLVAAATAACQRAYRG